MVILAEQRAVGHGIERVDGILPDGVALRRSLGVALGREVLLDHGPLLLGHTERLPQPLLTPDDDRVQQTAQQNAPDAAIPNLLLLVQRLRFSQPLRLAAHAGQEEKPFRQLQRVARTARVEQPAATEYPRPVRQPELEGVTRHVWTQLVDQQAAKLVVLALAKQFPHIRVAQRLEGRNFELEQMILGRVEIDGVDAFGLFEREGEDVVSGAGESEDHVVGLDFEDTRVHAAVLPREGIDVLIVELLVLLELVVVINSPVVVLVPETGQRKLAGEVDDGGFVSFGVTFEGFGALQPHFRLEIKGLQEGGLGGGGVEFGKLLFDGGAILGAPDPDIVWYPDAQHVVARIDAQLGAKSVFEIIAPRSVQVDAIELEPGSPEGATEPGAVPVDDAAGVVPASIVVLVLDVKVDHCDDAVVR